jgi:large subunit ribosomal protein L25
VGEYAIDVELRQEKGKGVARKLRAAGRIPGVCYRRNAESAAISLDPKVLEKLLRKATAGMNTLFDLNVAGGGDFDGRQVLVKDLQVDPVTKRFLHADLYAVDLAQKIHVSVPIQVAGIAAGVTLGGILDHALRVVEVECLPDAIPEEFSVDVTDLEMGQSIHVRELVVPEGVEVLGDLNLSIISVVAPAVAEEEVTPTEEGLEEGAEVPTDGAEGAAPAEGEAKEKGGD